MIASKACTKCGEQLPATPEYFHRAPHGKYGLKSWCKSCASNLRKKYYWEQEIHRAEENRHRQRQWYHENREKAKAKTRRQYRKHRTKRLKYARKYREQNKERISKERRAYYEANRDSELRTHALWKENNADRCRQLENRRRSRKAELPADFALEEWFACLDHFDGCCAYCGTASQELQQDHFIPVSARGAYTASNIVPACPWCNLSKKDRLFEEWYPLQDFHDKGREQRLRQYLASKAGD